MIFVHSISPVCIKKLQILNKGEKIFSLRILTFLFLDGSSEIVLHTEQHWIFKNHISSKDLTSSKLSYSYFLFL